MLEYQDSRTATQFLKPKKRLAPTGYILLGTAEYTQHEVFEKHWQHDRQFMLKSKGLLDDLLLTVTACCNTF